MALTRDFRETIQARAKREAAFRKALLKEAIDCMLAGDVDTGKTVLRDYINATVGFAQLSAATRKSPKSLMRMLGPEGNPQARNLFEIVAYLQKSEGFRLTTRTTATAADVRVRGFAEEAHRQSLAVGKSRHKKADQDFIDAIADRSDK
jgi:DNA-binding phage protein